MSQIINIQNVTSNIKTFSEINLLEFFINIQDESHDLCQKISDSASANVLNQKQKITITCNPGDKVMLVSQMTIAVEKL